MKNLLSVLLSLSLIFGMGVTNQDYVEAAKSSNSTSLISSQQGDLSQKSSHVRFAKRGTSTKSKSTKKSTTKKSTKSKSSTKKSTKKSSTKKSTKSNAVSSKGSSTKQATIFNVEYTADTTQGKIKGNSNSMIYHVPGGASYDKISVNNVVYFDTEQDAINAGYRKAKR